MKLSAPILGLSLLALTAPARALDLNPRIVNFGEVGIGYSALFTFEVYNDSHHTVRITSVWNDNPEDFNFNTDCIGYLASHDSCRVGVWYEPGRSAILDHARIKINYLDEDGDDHDEVFNAYGRPW